MLKTVVRKFSQYEKYETLTAMDISVAFKLTLARFVNTALVPIMVNGDASKWFLNGGLVSDVFYIIVLACFLDPIMFLVDPAYFIKRLSRWY